MIIVTLIMTMLSTTSNVTVEVTRTLPGDMYLQCAVGSAAQTIAEQWIEEGHPNYRLVKHACIASNRPMEKKA